MRQFDNPGFVTDVEDIMRYVGERVAIRAKQSDWSFTEVKNELRYHFIDKGYTHAYELFLYGWRDAKTDWFEAEVTAKYADKKNNQLTHLLKKGE